MSDDAQAGYVSTTLVGITLPVDSAWEIDEVDGGAVVTRPADRTSGFRPNLVLRRLQVPTGVSMARQSTVAFSADRALLTGTQFISDDVWPHGNRLGRMHVTLHRVAAHSLMVQRWLLPLGSETLEATGSYTSEQATLIEPLMRYMVTHIVEAGEHHA